MRAIFFGVGIFVSTLILYLLTAYPTVAYIDSGELAVANWTLGIAHPTGYPLYTLLGRLFSLLPFELIKTQILFGALCTSLAVAIFSMRLVRILNVTELVQQLTVAVAALAFGVAPLVWSQGVTNEVYSLHLLMLALVVPLLFEKYSPRNLILCSFVVGLSFGNHMSTVLLLPAVTYYLFVNRKSIIASPRSILCVIGVVALAASLYLYLPIRSAQDPVFNWGQPTNWGNFMRHVSGWQYQVWMFSRSFDELIRSFGTFAVILFKQFPPPYWLVIAYGFWIAWTGRRRMAVTLMLILSCNILYCLNFDIPDIDNYLLPSVLVLFTYSLLGIVSLAQVQTKVRLLGIPVLSALLIWGVVANWSVNNQSKNTSALDCVHNYYACADSNSIILCADWDYVSPWLYSHFYLKERPDVLMVDNELVRRSWYPDWIRHADDSFYRYIKTSVDAFLPHVQKFEAGQRYDPKKIEQTYQDILNKIMLYPNRIIYFDQSVSLATSPPGEIVVAGQILRVVRAGENYSPRDFKISPPDFGKPADAYNDRELLHLRQYNTMLEHMKNSRSPQPN